MKKTFLLCLFALLASATVAMAQVTVTGVVKDSEGPVAGATVTLRGTTRGATTNAQGQFSISVPDAKTGILEIKFLGMKDAFHTLDGRSSGIEITLESDAQSIDNVVVIGYGSTIRADLTGSVGSVAGSVLARVPVSSAAEALQGKIAGVQVSAVDGAPGAEINIRIRGGTSVTQSNSPLFIVDGFPAANINDIPPTDIASIDVLKDASLTAIYGAKGGNGVVIVTTKSAQVGNVTVSFNHNTQIRTLARKIEVMDAYNFVATQLDAVIRNTGDTEKFRYNFGFIEDGGLYKRFGVGNDWQDEILGGNPISQMYNITIGGGTPKLRFNTSVTHNDEKGVLVGSGVIRTNANTKINIDVSDKFRVFINPRMTYRQDNGTGADQVGGKGIIDVLRYRPTNGLRDFGYIAPENTDPEEEKYFKYSNPRGDIDQNYRKKNTYTLSNQASVEWTIIDGLVFRTEGNLSFSFSDDNQFWGDLTSLGQRQKNLPVAQITNLRGTSYTWTNVLTYGFSRDNHNYSFLAGQEIQHSSVLSSEMRSRYFPLNTKPDVALKNMSLGMPWTSSSAITAPDRTASFFGQANYNYDRRYLLSATMRADGSTKFAPGNQWGFFPAISGAWVISKEDFMQDQRLFSTLKVRLAFGLAGNNRIDEDMWRYQYNIVTQGGPGWGEESLEGYEYYQNSGGSTFPNSTIQWESTLTRTLGVDMGLFNERLTITPEIYWNTTRNLLYMSSIPSVSGYSNQMRNIGQVTNRGFELTVNGTIAQTPNFFLAGNFVFGMNKTRIDKLSGEEDKLELSSPRWSSSVNDYILKVGDQLGLIYGFVYDGIYGFDEFELSAGNTYNFTPLPTTVNGDDMFGTLPGRPKFKNIKDDPNSKTDINRITDDDRVIIGNTNPKFTGGFGFNGSWKNIDFSANFTFMYDFDVNNATRYTLSSGEGNKNNYHNFLADFSGDKRWRYSDEVGNRLVGGGMEYYETYKAINANATLFNPVDVFKKVTHSYFIEDGSFLRLQDLTVGYTFPTKLSGKIGMKNLRLYFSGYNLFLWTKYRGYDPEVDIQSGLTPGVDYNRYPRSRNFVFGLNVTF